MGSSVGPKRVLIGAIVGFSVLIAAGGGALVFLRYGSYEEVLDTSASEMADSPLALDLNIPRDAKHLFIGRRIGRPAYQFARFSASQTSVQDWVDQQRADPNWKYESADWERESDRFQTYWDTRLPPWFKIENISDPAILVGRTESPNEFGWIIIDSREAVAYVARVQ